MEVDDIDEQTLYFPKKRKSISNVIFEDYEVKVEVEFEADDDDHNDDDDDDDDELEENEDEVLYGTGIERELGEKEDSEYSYDDDGGDNLGIRPRDLSLSGYDENQRKYCEELEPWFKEPSPLFSSDEGEIDVSGAVFVKVSGRRLKKASKGRYDDLVDFMYNCRQKCSLQLFYHTGDPRTGGLFSTAGKRIRDEDRRLAALAISKYQEVKKDVKLKLRDVMKLNSVFWGHVFFYITFSAENEETGEIKTYQAALADCDDECLLGLFRDVVDSKVLAVLSVTGARDDYAAKVKICEDARNPLRNKANSSQGIDVYR